MSTIIMPHEYHLRLAITLELAPSFIEMFEKWRKKDIISLVVSHELGKENKQPHIHMYLNLEKPLNRSSISTWMIKKGYTKLYSFTEQRKTTVNHIAYIIKDGEILKSTVEPHIMKAAEGITLEVQKDQKRSTIQKIIMFKEDKVYALDTIQQAYIIVYEYYRSIDKIPHTRHIIQYYGNALFIHFNEKRYTSADILEMCYGLAHDNLEIKPPTKETIFNEIEQKQHAFMTFFTK